MDYAESYGRRVGLKRQGDYITCTNRLDWGLENFESRNKFEQFQCEERDLVHSLDHKRLDHFREKLIAEHIEKASTNVQSAAFVIRELEKIAKSGDVRLDAMYQEAVKKRTQDEFDADVNRMSMKDNYYGG